MAATKPIKTFCNEGCQKPFTITKMPTIKAKQGIEKTYFRCTHCKHEYIGYYASVETLKLQKEMRKLQRDFSKINAIKDDMQYRNLLLKINELKSKIKKSMDEARLIAET